MMKNWMKGGSVCLAAFALTFGQSASAAPACWDQTDVAAAKIRNLQSRLMVATMRCSAMGIDVLPAYNAFVRSNRETIQGANGVLKAQFAADTAAAGQSLYDSYATSLANAFGAEQTSVEVCQKTAALAEEAVTANGDIAALLAIEERAGSQPDLPGGQCPITFAGFAPN